MVRSRLAIVIPAKNEQKTISKVISSLKKFGDIYIVDDSSSDSTLNIIKKLNVNIILNNKEIGYEKSLLKGILTVLDEKNSYEFIATFDADGEHDPNFLKNIDNPNFDILIGSRNKFNRSSEYIFSFFSKKIFNIRDMLSGLRIYKVSFLKKIYKHIKFGFINTHILILAVINNAKIVEKKMVVSTRKGISRFGSGLKTNLYIIYIMFKWIIYFYKKNK